MDQELPIDQAIMNVMLRVSKGGFPCKEQTQAMIRLQESLFWWREYERVLKDAVQVKNEQL